MRIDIDDTWAVISGEYDYRLVRKTIGQSGASEGKTLESFVGSYTTLEAAFSAAGGFMFRACDAQGVVACLQAAQDIGAKLGRLYDQSIKPKRKAA